MALLRRDFSEGQSFPLPPSLSLRALVLNLVVYIEYDPTVEDSYTCQLTLDGQDYTIEIIDTAGQEEYRGLWAETSAREGDGFILT